MLDHAPLVDDEGRAVDHQRNALPVAPLLVGAVATSDLGALVDEQRKVQAVLVDEGPLRVRPLGADAQHDVARLHPLVDAVSELARLDSASWGVVRGVEVENDPAALQVRKAPGLAGCILQLEGWSRIALRMPR